MSELAEWMERHHARVSYEVKNGVFHATVEIREPAAVLKADAEEPIHAMARAMQAAYEATGDWT